MVQGRLLPWLLMALYRIKVFWSKYRCIVRKSCVLSSVSTEIILILQQEQFSQQPGNCLHQSHLHKTHRDSPTQLWRASSAFVIATAQASPFGVRESSKRRPCPSFSSKHTHRSNVAHYPSPLRGRVCIVNCTRRRPSASNLGDELVPPAARRLPVRPQPLQDRRPRQRSRRGPGALQHRLCASYAIPCRASPWRNQ